MASRSMRIQSASYTPSSPLSPTMTPSVPDLKLPLPRFHPAVYKSPNSAATTRGLHSPTRTRHQGGLRPLGPPLLQQRQVSDVQYKLQRELITRATSAFSTSSAGTEMPKAPPLLPCGSPGPATPLTLSEQGDYLAAGIGAVASPDLVDKMIRAEKERRSGVHSGQSSPAVSPAGKCR